MLVQTMYVFSSIAIITLFLVGTFSQVIAGMIHSYGL